MCCSETAVRSQGSSSPTPQPGYHYPQPWGPPLDGPAGQLELDRRNVVFPVWGFLLSSWFPEQAPQILPDNHKKRENTHLCSLLPNNWKAQSTDVQLSGHLPDPQSGAVGGLGVPRLRNTETLLIFTWAQITWGPNIEWDHPRERPKCPDNTWTPILLAVISFSMFYTRSQWKSYEK